MKKQENLLFILPVQTGT